MKPTEQSQELEGRALGLGPAQLNRGPGVFLALIAAVLALVLVAVFWRGFIPGLVVSSPNPSFAQFSSQAYASPELFSGIWHDLNAIGESARTPPPSVRWLFLALAGPLLFAKWQAAFCLFLLGTAMAFCAWQWRLRPVVCLLASLAAAFNGSFFSNACSGHGDKATAAACFLVALGFLARSHGGGRSWIVPTALAGAALGQGINEGDALGLFFAAVAIVFVILKPSNVPDATAPGAVAGLKIVVLSWSALFVAAQSLWFFSASTHDDKLARESPTSRDQESWNAAVQWSLPKIEALRVVIPGLFGCQMDTPSGGNYWGAVGRTPGWEQTGRGRDRSSSSGEYAGVLVLLVAAWSWANLSRGAGSSLGRGWNLFWPAVAGCCLVISFGRFAPFYQWIFNLPWVGPLTYPLQFMPVFHVALLLSFASGLDQFLYDSAAELASGEPRACSWIEHVKKSWEQTQARKRMALGLLASACLISLLGWIAFAIGRPLLVRHLEQEGFDVLAGADIAAFSLKEAGMFVVALFTSSALVFAAACRGLIGAKARWSWRFAGLTGLLLAADLFRANWHWMNYSNVETSTASNPIVERLRERPWERRVSLLQIRPGAALDLFEQVYFLEWLRLVFPRFNVHSLNDKPGTVEDEEFRNFRDMLGRTNALLRPRFWQLTSTGWMLGRVEFEQLLNYRLDPRAKRFQIRQRFDLTPKPNRKPAEEIELQDFAVSIASNGPLALIEFMGALPRASLVPRWQITPNRHELLKKLADPLWSPEQIVLLERKPKADWPDRADPPDRADLPTVKSELEWVSYQPKEIVVRTTSGVRTVLLVNDRFDSDWQVTVDGIPGELLRANYLMRGVALEKGEHRVALVYRPEVPGRAVTLGALVTALLLLAAQFRTRSRAVSGRSASLPYAAIS